MVRFVTMCMMMLFLCPPDFFSQWRPLSTIEGHSLKSVYFAGDNHGWIAGSSGSIYKFDPHLFNWINIPTGTSAHLNSIAFFDTLNGFAVGTSGTILFSSDGGNTWNPGSAGTSEDLNEIFILDENKAWIAGNNGTLLRTINRGLNWFPVSIPTTANLTSVHFTDAFKGFVGTDMSTLFKTTDAGVNWTQFTFPSDYIIKAIHFPDSLNGFIGGGKNDFQTGVSFSRKTTDGGNSWLEGPYTPGGIHSIYYKDAENGIITGGDNSWNRFIRVTKNSVGRTEIYHNEDYDIYSCFITPSGKGWAVGSGGAVFYAESFTEDWAQILTQGTDTPMSLSVSKDNHFFLASRRFNFREPGDIFQKGFYENRLWKDVSEYQDNTGGGDVSTHFIMIDSLYGYNLLNGMGVHRTTDGAASWDYITSLDEEGGIFFLNRSLGWSWGYGIYKTTNNGFTWNQLYSANFLISDLIFTNGSIGYACGSDDSLQGKVIKSTDGGNSWFTLPVPLTSHLTSVSFTSPDTGIVVGWESTLLKTYDGGATWIASSSERNIEKSIRYSIKPIPLKKDRRSKISRDPASGLFKEVEVTTTGNYLDIDFKDRAAFVASDSGYVLMSTDYGNTWTSSVIGSPVYEVKFDGSQYAAARGDDNVYLFKFQVRIPAELIKFSAEYIAGSVHLEWLTASEINNSGFQVEKNSDGTWTSIAFVKGMGTTTELSRYSYIDNEPGTGTLIKYRLKQVDYSGTFKYSDEVNVVTGSIDYVLLQNYPNPFNPETKIIYQIPLKEEVQVYISDVLGKIVAVLDNSEKAAGIYEINFNSEDYNLSSGVYFYTVKAGSFTSTKKMMLLK
jgi:photosystem II stability/assembly factor-like uncharacterized protein